MAGSLLKEERKMIDRKKYQLNYIKKERQSGSFQGMRFTFSKKEEELLVTVYSEPFCLEATPEEKRTEQAFPFTGEGLDEAVEWLNALYSEKKDFWTDAYEKRMQV